MLTVELKKEEMGGKGGERLGKGLFSLGRS